MSTTQPDLDAVVDTMDLEEIDLNLYRGVSPDWEVSRLFGGHVAAQSLAAAYRTIDDIHVHSLHSYFLRPGDASIPVVFHVDRIRDGRSFATRLVVARQRGEAIFNLSASFHKVEDGFDHQVNMPDVAGPDEFPTASDFGHELSDYMPSHWAGNAAPMEIRSQIAPRGSAPEGQLHGHVWQRSNGSLPDDEALHRIMLTYMSDMALLGTSVRAHAPFSDRLMVASLDHAIWFHRSVRADRWLLYSLTSPSASNARGFNQGQYFTEEGVLVASAAQEGLMRPIEGSKESS